MKKLSIGVLTMAAAAIMMLGTPEQALAATGCSSNGQVFSCIINGSESNYDFSLNGNCGSDCDSFLNGNCGSDCDSFLNGNCGSGCDSFLNGNCGSGCDSFPNESCGSGFSFSLNGSCGSDIASSFNGSCGILRRIPAVTVNSMQMRPFSRSDCFAR